MSTPAIRLLLEDDLEEALRLSSTAGWNQQLEDWRMLRGLAPLGSFAAVADGRIVGTSMGIPYSGFSWIAMMLVDPAHRGAGVGRRLLEAAVQAVPNDRPIRLDATPLGRPLYESFGFVEESRLTRMTASAASRHITPRAAEPRARPLEQDDLDGVLQHDQPVFGADRVRVLRWALARAPQYGRVTTTPAGTRGYCLGRCGRLFDQIGPVVAADDETARTLVGEALALAGDREVAIDAFDDRTGFSEWLRDSGFIVQRPLYRMSRPAIARSPDAARGRLHEYAIFGPEFA